MSRHQSVEYAIGGGHPIGLDDVVIDGFEVLFRTPGKQHREGCQQYPNWGMPRLTALTKLGPGLTRGKQK
jgi:hypothetical protein